MSANRQDGVPSTHMDACGFAFDNLRCQILVRMSAKSINVVKINGFVSGLAPEQSRHGANKCKGLGQLNYSSTCHRPDRSVRVKYWLQPHRYRKTAAYGKKVVQQRRNGLIFPFSRTIPKLLQNSKAAIDFAICFS
jgi:hypothetical protein